jgi:hypothetical protein
MLGAAEQVLEYHIYPGINLYQGEYLRRKVRDGD